MSDAEERARIRQVDFYLELSARFARMADEYSPANHAKNPIPIHGITAVIVVHSSTTRSISNEARAIANSIETYLRNTDENGKIRSHDIHHGRGSLKIASIYPEQTDENYMNELRVWAAERRAQRDKES